MKKRTLKKVFTCLAFALSTSLLFAACGTKEAPQGSGAGLKGSISVVGSTSVQPLAQELADAFSKKEPGIKIDIQGVGSTAGVKSANDGACDIGTSSRDLTKEEKAWGLTEHIIALDGIAVCINPKNNVADLTFDQITKIFKGEIKNWKEIGGADKEIIVVSREAGSGTRGAFEELTKLETKKDNKTVSLLLDSALIAEGNGAVKANISSKDNAIGYLSLGTVDATIKALKVNGVLPSVETIKSKQYAIARPFVMLTKSNIKPESKAYLDYILSDEGQSLVKKHYISIK